MGKGLLVTFLIIVGLIVLPLVLFITFGILSTVLPFLGILMLLGLPAIIIGVIIGATCAKKKKDGV